MCPLDHLLGEVPMSHSWLPDEVFTPLGWYFEQGLWVQDALAPGNRVHNYPLPMRIRGSLNREALGHSLQEVLRRHHVLRSVFRNMDGKLAQMIVPLQPLTMSVLDLTNLPERDRESKARQLVLEDATRPFDLTCGPMLRTGLLRLGTEDHILQLTTHHIVCDDWSTGILLRELFALYVAFSMGNPSPLPELAYQYGDFVRGVQKKLQGKDLTSRVAFWKGRLAGGNDFHHVTPDHPRSMPRSYRGAHERAIFPEDLTNFVKVLSQREAVSPFMTMMAGLQCLLKIYSGQDHIGVGSCVANRSLLQLEGLIGPFANVSVLRTDLSGNPTFRDVLRRVREVSLTAYSYQDLPFGTLLEYLQPRPDPSRNPLFQVLFVLLNAPNEPWHLPGLTVDPFPLDTGTTRYELNLWVKLHECLEVDLQYNSDLFEAATIRQILRDYGVALEVMSKNPEARVSELAIQKQRVAIKGQQQPEYARTEYVAPNGAMESRLVELWEAVLDKRPIGVNDDFFELGGDSLRAVRLFAQIGEVLKLTIPLGSLFQAPTIATLAKAICEAGSSDTCVVTIQSGDNHPPLFCLPGQTGSILMYRSLAQHLGSDQPVYGLQPQGLDGKQPPLTRIEDMAATFVRKIRVIQPQGPYFLAGYCMGGTIALEMAQQLRSQGQTVGLLALLDTYNWGLLKRTSFVDDLYFRVQQWWFSWKRCGLRWRDLRDPKRPYPFLLVALPGREKSLRRFSEFWNKPAAEVVSECNRRAAISYVPQVYSGRVLHVRPTRQYTRYNRPEMSLNGLAANGVEEFFLPGYPAQILEEPLVRHLAVKLRACIDEFAATKGVGAGAAQNMDGREPPGCRHGLVPSPNAPSSPSH
jgi:thioesterase domain-containing protein/acyl carrier protein